MRHAAIIILAAIGAGTVTAMVALALLTWRAGAGRRAGREQAARQIGGWR